MSHDESRLRRLECRLARLLRYGTWIASAVIATGLVLTSLAGTRPVPSYINVVTLGIALFILLPVSRVLLMLIVFVRERDYRFSAIAAFVLLIIVIGFALGALSSS